MTQAWDCPEARPSLGVYVLGAIDPAERSLVDAHLTTCRDCRDELAGLAGLPALLARVNPDEVSRIQADDTVHAGSGERPPAELLGTVLDLTAARRRRNRWRVAAAAAAVVAVAGGLFGGVRTAVSTTHTVYAEEYSGGAAKWETAQTASQVTGVNADIRYANELWGSDFEVLVHGIRLGTTCELWVILADGSRTKVASWTVAPDEGRVWYSGSMPDSSQPISSIQITAGNKVLLTATPA